MFKSYLKAKLKVINKHLFNHLSTTNLFNLKEAVGSFKMSELHINKLAKLLLWLGLDPDEMSQREWGRLTKALKDIKDSKR